jgi:hypothetical protein
MRKLPVALVSVQIITGSVDRADQKSEVAHELVRLDVSLSQHLNTKATVP